jgi:hypothetical protein
MKLCANRYSNASVFCGQCSVTPYCSDECRKKHWKSSHKPYCKPLSALPDEATLEAWLIPEVAEKETDLNTHYLAIEIMPKASLDTDKLGDEYISQLRGLTELDISETRMEPGGSHFPYQPGTGALCKRLGWKTIPGKEIVNGYCAEDAVILKYICDDNYQNEKTLLRNELARLVLNNPHPTRGSIVIFATPNPHSPKFLENKTVQTALEEGKEPALKLRTPLMHACILFSFPMPLPSRTSKSSR